MFDQEYFTKLLNQTVDYIQNKEKHKNVEDLDAKIESNKLALKIISEDIEDIDLKNKILQRLDNLYDTYEIIELKQRTIKSDQYSDVEEDILKNTQILKDKAKRLYNGLIFDKDVLDRVSHKISKNITDTSENIKKIKKDRNSHSIVGLLFYGLTIFLIEYFVLRFL